MIEIVDLVEMLAIQAAALDFVGEDVEIESVGILRRDQMHFPEREKDRHGNRDCGGEQQQTRPKIQRLVRENETRCRSKFDIFPRIRFWIGETGGRDPPASLRSN